jgi:hypothetical protein
MAFGTSGSFAAVFVTFAAGGGSEEAWNDWKPVREQPVDKDGGDR